MKSVGYRMGKVWLSAGGIAFLSLALTLVGVYKGKAPAAHGQSHDEGGGAAEPLAVQVVKAKAGGVERTTTQPGTDRAFDYEELYAKVAGYLIHQKVDIGTEVNKV